MWECCRQNPCHPRCPNAEPEVVFYCERCAEPISAGDTYAAVCDAIICEECLTEMTAAEWLEIAGGEKKTA